MSWALDRLTIGTFRGVRDLELEGLGQVNLVVGPNDSGKTSVLEAIELLADPLAATQWAIVGGRRERGRLVRSISALDRVALLFPRGEPGEPDASSISMSTAGRHVVANLRASLTEKVGVRILTETTRNEGPVFDDDSDPGPERRVIKVDVDVAIRNGMFDTPEQRSFELWEDERILNSERRPRSVPTQYVGPHDHAFLPLRDYSRARLEGTDGNVLSLLREFDPRVLGLEMLMTTGRPVLFVRDSRAGLLPISSFGDGLQRALHIALRLPLAAHGILLIDEVEVAMHPSALTHLYKWLLDACKQYDVQAFLSTHSLEAIDAIIDADETPEEDVVGYRIYRGERRTEVRRFGEDLLKRLRRERGLDIR